MTNLGFVDIETTSLERPFTTNPNDIIWEVGLVVRADIEHYDGPDNDVEYRWYLPVNYALGNPESLAIGRFDERYPAKTGKGYITPPAVFVHEFTKAIMDGLQDGDTKPFLVGNVVSFDEERLAALFVNNGISLEWLPWHYHLVDVEALAAGRLGLQPPWKGSTVSEALGVPVPEGQHDALVDALWARDMYDTVIKHASDDTVRYSLREDDRTAIFEAIGEASMCWEPRPAGVFQSEEAKDVGNNLIEKLTAGQR